MNLAGSIDFNHWTGFLIYPVPGRVLISCFCFNIIKRPTFGLGRRMFFFRRMKI